MRGGWVYTVTNRPNGTLYTGVTSNMPRRAFEHRNGLINGFSKRYGLKQLVWYEFHDDIRLAIQREHNMKHWPRAWKVRLIISVNPEWNDLYHTSRICTTRAISRWRRLPRARGLRSCRPQRAGLPPPSAASVRRNRPRRRRG